MPFQLTSCRMLFIIGTVYRALAYAGLIGINRDKQV